MLRRLLSNWKTTTAGVSSILFAVVHLVFAIRAHTATEETWNTSILAVLGGLGLLFAGDASNSQTKDDPKP